MTQKELVRNFVQNVLGCGCPEGVFEEIEVKQGPVDIDGIPVTRSIKVGGRLLIYIILSEDLNDVSDSLKALIQSGKKMRDSEGLNRFRLVVASRSAGTDWEALGQAFHEIQDIDDRLHLHVIDSQTLPPLL
ncbi:MAG: hypothetical protein JRJ51_07985 [Deltaproteobacteria bacterium]|nr:hypothetical protein [Deltaproteobacteria bacterium]